jgi:hypothetical protein
MVAEEEEEEENVVVQIMPKVKAKFKKYSAFEKLCIYIISYHPHIHG